jgi:hypothetical protein
MLNGRLDGLHMPSTRLRDVVRLMALLAAFGVTAAADGTGSKRDLDQLKQKVAHITAFGERPSLGAQRVPVREAEINAYLAIEARQQLPVGVLDPSVTMLDAGRLSGRAVVDLDAVRKEKNPTSLLDPLFYVAGRLPVTATGVLTTGQGSGRFQLESATLGGVPIPKIVLQEIVGYYSRTPANPAGFGLDDAFALPARIREIHVERGQAIVVQ